jgi:hypothetical protein
MKDHARTQRRRGSAAAHTRQEGAAVGAPLPTSVLALQRTAGNAAAGVLARELLQRDKTKTKTKVKTKQAPPRIDDAAAARDYANALKYVEDFYDGVDKALELHDKVRASAQINYEKIGELQDPPSLGEEVVKALFSVVMSKIPGWDLIEKGLTIGLFASELGKLKLELDEYPIPGYTVEDADKAGPSEATKARAKKKVEHAKTGWEAASKVYDTVVDVMAKQKAAAEAEAKALQSAGLSQQRITDWAKGTAAAQKEEKVVTDWVKKAGADAKLRGRMEAAVTKRLGPVAVIDPAQVETLTRRYELELYRMKFGGPDGAGKNVSTVYTGGWSDSEPTRPELRVAGGLSKATRRRIAWCAGVTGIDDETMVKVLGIPTIIERKRNPGLRHPGEI